MNASVRPVQAKRVSARRHAPIRSESPLFLVGKNSRGNWVARDQSGLCGGLFIGRAAALKFALSENGNRPEAVRMVTGVLELDMTATPNWAAPASRKPGAGPLQRVA